MSAARGTYRVDVLAIDWHARVRMPRDAVRAHGVTNGAPGRPSVERGHGLAQRDDETADRRLELDA